MIKNRKIFILFIKISIVFSSSFLLILYFSYFFYEDYSKSENLENVLARNSINAKIVSVDLNLMLLNSKINKFDKVVLKQTKENLIYSSNYTKSGKRIIFSGRSFPEGLSSNNKLISKNIQNLQNSSEFEFIKILANESKFQNALKKFEDSNNKLWNYDFKNQYFIFNFTGFLKKNSVGIILKTKIKNEKRFEVYLTDYLVDKLMISPREDFYLFNESAELLFSNSDKYSEQYDTALSLFIKERITKTKFDSGVQLHKIGENDYVISYEEIPTFGFWGITVLKNEKLSAEIREIKFRLTIIFSILFFLSEILIYLFVLKMRNDA